MTKTGYGLTGEGFLTFQELAKDGLRDPLRQWARHQEEQHRPSTSLLKHLRVHTITVINTNTAETESYGDSYHSADGLWNALWFPDLHATKGILIQKCNAKNEVRESDAGAHARLLPQLNIPHSLVVPHDVGVKSSALKNFQAAMLSVLWSKLCVFPGKAKNERKCTTHQFRELARH